MPQRPYDFVEVIMSTRDDFLFRGDLSALDPAVAQLIDLEAVLRGPCGRRLAQH
jgi:hypothetical protein